MQKYFNINLEFNKEAIHYSISKVIESKAKGYICVVDGNVLATANKNKAYLTIVNNALINTCDGSSIALLAGLIHKKKFKTYTGPEIFVDYTQRKYRQYLLGNTKENLIRIKNKFQTLNYPADLFHFEPLPFSSVENFDYKGIAAKINEFQPDIIWVSLGAPKQEIFISKLYPYIDQGIMFAIGAAFNLFLEDENNQRSPLWMRNLHLEWLYRIGREPKRVGKRAFMYLILLPKLIITEIKNKNCK
jgi:N-acetylglucosaminyldiphosphoundecaprenol N-acetyl-beta-D-mannosaminyltransferase